MSFNDFSKIKTSSPKDQPVAADKDAKPEAGRPMAQQPAKPAAPAVKS